MICVLYWPQHQVFYLHISSLPQLAFLSSMAGLLSVVALEVTGKAHLHHILGIACDSGLKYNLHLNLAKLRLRISPVKPHRFSISTTRSSSFLINESVIGFAHVYGTTTLLHLK